MRIIIHIKFHKNHGGSFRGRWLYPTLCPCPRLKATSLKGLMTTVDIVHELTKFILLEFREIYRGADNLCTVSGLHPGKSYSFCVRAANEAGVGLSCAEL